MSELMTWKHVRKGRIRGRVVRTDETWTDIRLEGDHYWGVDGEVVTVRTSFLTELGPEQ